MDRSLTCQSIIHPCDAADTPPTLLLLEMPPLRDKGALATLFLAADAPPSLASSLVEGAAAADPSSSAACDAGDARITAGQPALTPSRGPRATPMGRSSWLLLLSISRGGVFAVPTVRCRPSDALPPDQARVDAGHV